MRNPKSSVKMNHKDKKILLNRTFAKMAENPDSDEYKLLRQLRQDNPDYAVVIREIRKNLQKDSYRGLTYDYMRKYIEKYAKDNCSERLQEFDAIIDRSRCHSLAYRYPIVKSWFLSEYPEVKTIFTNKAQSPSEQSETVRPEVGLAVFLLRILIVRRI